MFNKFKAKAKEYGDKAQVAIQQQQAQMGGNHGPATTSTAPPPPPHTGPADQTGAYGPPPTAAPVGAPVVGAAAGAPIAGSSTGAPSGPTMDAVGQPIAIFPQFIAQKTENLVLKEKVFSFSGDSYDIKTVEGVPIFKVQGSKFSLSGRKTFADQAGNTLFVLKKELISLHTTFFGEGPQEQKLFEVKSKFSIGSSKAYINFTDANGKAHSLFMKGDFFDREAKITDETTGTVVATINRKFFNASEILGGQQTYVLSVAPGFDMALMAAACICLDEKNNEK